MSIVRAAVVQDNPVVFDREATIEKVRSLVKEAASQETDLVLFPEGKYDLDTPGHYARPDVFQLQVNLRKQNIVTTWDANLKDPFEN